MSKQDPLAPGVRTAVERIAYSPAEVAEALGASIAWVHVHLADGTIPSTKIAGLRRVKRDDLIELLDHEHFDGVA